MPPGHLIEAHMLGGSRKPVWLAVFLPIALLYAFRAGTAGVVIAVVGVFAVGILLRKRVLAALRWTPATLEVPEALFALGSSPIVVYRRKRRRVGRRSTFTVQCTLTCEERATYRRGSNTRTDTSKVFEQTFTSDGQMSRHGLEARIQLQVSANAGSPSFELGHNEVRWFVEAVTTGPGLPGDTQWFPIRVGPVLDPQQRNRQGDR